MTQTPPTHRSDSFDPKTLTRDEVTTEIADAALNILSRKKQYADGAFHTNTIERVWVLIKRAWYGSHNRYSRHWILLYIAEACWKYIHRQSESAFKSFLRGLFA